ncbi:MAG: MFS transporter [Acidobacteria bacterium]|nr:MFS transporter [Acidobacteriota bacterium]
MSHTPDGWLQRLGLGRPELRAWAMYDWANSAFLTTIVAAVFPIYYNNVAARGMAPQDAAFRFSLATTAALVVSALLAPVLGAIADHRPAKKAFLGGFMLLGVIATALMALIEQGDWALALGLFMAGNIAASGSIAFYDSLLPHIAAPDELDRVSSSGFALGYLGGGLLLAINLAWILQPRLFGLPDAGVATRLAFFSVAVWWFAFSLPLFRRVPEPAIPGGGEATLAAATRRALGDLRQTFARLRRYRQAFLMLLAFLIYNDGIGTIIRMASLYGAQLGIAEQHLIGALLLVQFVGVPCAFLFGWLAGRIGAKRSIFLALTVYAGISVLGYFMTSAVHFYALAILVGMVQGGSQALSRSLFASMIPRERSSEFFGFFAVTERTAGILGPLTFAAAIALTGSSRAAILSVIAFFVVGALVLSRVDVAAGQQAAKSVNA